MTWSDEEIADKTYANRCVPIELKDTGKGRYDDMARDFYAYVTGTKENPFSYAHEYAVQEVISEVIGGVQFYGHDIG